jgi:hypothetical protein
VRRLPSRRTLDGALRWIITSWKAAVGVAGGLAVILGLVFHPPWGGSSSSSASDTKTKTTTQACPGISKGRISNVKADPPIPLSAYWKLNPGSRVPASKERLNAIGRVVHFNVDINGYRGKQLTVWWWMLTANGEPLPETTLRRQLAFGLTPHDCATGGTREIWAELPKRNGQFLVEIQLLDPNSEKLGYGRTAPFAVETASG